MAGRGQIRQAFASVAEALAKERRAATWRDMAAAAGCVNLASPAEAKLARKTVHNMAAAGELVRVGSVSTPWACRPMTLFEPAARGACGAGPTSSLDGVFRTWRRA